MLARQLSSYSSSEKTMAAMPPFVGKRMSNLSALSMGSNQSSPMFSRPAKTTARKHAPPRHSRRETEWEAAEIVWANLEDDACKTSSSSFWPRITLAASLSMFVV